MCHQTVRPSLLDQSQASGDAPGAPPQRDRDAELVLQEGDLNLNTGTPQEAQSNDSTPEEQRERESFEDCDCGTEDKNQPPHGLCFSSSGDFVGFVSPASSSSSGDLPSSHDSMVKTASNMHKECDENGKDPPLPWTPDTVRESSVEGQKESKEELTDNFTSCGRLPQNFDGTDKSLNRLNSPETQNADTNQEAVSVMSLIDSQTIIKSCNDNSTEHLDLVEDSQSHKGNGACSDFDLGRLSSSDATSSCTSTDNHD